MYTVPLVCEATFESTVHDADQEHTDYSSSPAAKVVRDFYKAKDLSATAWTSTTVLGRPDQTVKFSISIKSKSIRLIFGRIDRVESSKHGQRVWSEPFAYLKSR